MHIDSGFERKESRCIVVNNFEKKEKKKTILNGMLGHVASYWYTVGTLLS